MSKKKKLIPKMRFPEFKNEGEWEEKELDYVLDYLQPTPYLVESTDYNDKYKTPVLTAGKSFILGYTNEDKGIFKNNLPVIIFDDFTTATQFVDFPFKGKSSAMKILKAKKGADIKFSYESMQLIKYEVGVHQRHWISIFSKLKIPTPNLKEQKKIASCLSSLDDLIEAHSQKLDFLFDHKSGLMQNLFPQKGEKVPKLRFKEFKKDKQWEEKKLEGLAKRGSGHTPYKQMPNYYDGGIKWVSLADSNKLDNRYIYDTKIKISKEGIENSSAVLHPAGAVILSRDAGVGKSAVLYSEMAVSQHFIVWVCNQAKLSHWYLYYVLQILKPVFESIAVGSTIKTIGLTYFKELLIPVPSINEQRKIAFCLSSLDEIISVQTDKIEQLKQHKKGLLQALFPKMIH